MTGRARMLAALRRQPVDRTPVWFMRQAGRSLAAYRELRERYDILTITRTPELCARVTLMPVNELGVDAAVLYADIMLPLVGMGVPFSIDPGLGPIIHEPLRSAADIARLVVVESAEEATPDLFTAIRGVRQQLGARAAVIGFAGAPFTVASYLIEGHPSRDYARSKALMHGEPELWERLMEKLAEVTIRYLRAQVAAGVDVLQLFELLGRRAEPARLRGAGPPPRAADLRGGRRHRRPPDLLRDRLLASAGVDGHGRRRRGLGGLATAPGRGVAPDRHRSSASRATSTPPWPSPPGRWWSARRAACSTRRADATATSSTWATGSSPTPTPPPSGGSSSWCTRRPAR